MVESRQPAEIAILLYPGAQLAAVHGLTDLFAVASRLAVERHRGGKGARTREAPAAALRVSHFEPRRDGEGPGCTFDSLPGGPHRPAAVILPPSLGAPPGPEIAAPLAPWLVAQHGQGALLCSVCAGAFVLAGTGLLDRRAATTHWVYAATLAERFPTLRVDVDKLVIDDGDIITAGGLLAWTDLGLRLVDRLLGPTVMLETARFMLVDPAGREQRFYSSFSPRLQHGDAPVLKVQRWLQTQAGVKVSVPEMAAQAGLSERTFLRRFLKATGMKPTEYCQHLRVGKAREMLEFTANSIDDIAWRVGYEDPGSFRKVFLRVMGLSPGEYRRRFGVQTGG